MKTMIVNLFRLRLDVNIAFVISGDNWISVIVSADFEH